MQNTNRQKPKLQKIPPSVTTPIDYEILAKDFINHDIFEYISGGSGSEQTLRQNIDAFSEISIYNRVLRNCQQGGTQTHLLGNHLRHPILLAPVAYQKLVHPEGELASAQAAEAMESTMIASTLSSYSLEDIAECTNGSKWFQLYWQANRQDSIELIQRAEKAGYSALVITIDTPIQSVSNQAKRAGFTMPEDVSAANLSTQTTSDTVSLTPNQSIIFQGMMSEAPSWEDIEWLIKNTSLPIVAKGVLHPADALKLKSLGVAGIVVSNHGGRALDCVPASITALEALRNAVGDEYPLLLDSGIRSGYDVFKALALGADAVCIGRLQIYALAVAGALGVAHMLKLLRDELEYCMALTGCPTIESISSDTVFNDKNRP